MAGIKLYGNGKTAEVLNKNGHYLICPDITKEGKYTIICYEGNRNKKKNALTQYQKFMKGKKELRR